MADATNKLASFTRQADIGAGDRSRAGWLIWSVRALCLTIGARTGSTDATMI